MGSQANGANKPFGLLDQFPRPCVYRSWSAVAIEPLGGDLETHLCSSRSGSIVVYEQNGGRLERVGLQLEPASKFLDLAATQSALQCKIYRRQSHWPCCCVVFGSVRFCSVVLRCVVLLLLFAHLNDTLVTLASDLSVSFTLKPRGPHGGRAKQMQSAAFRPKINRE